MKSTAASAAAAGEASGRFIDTERIRFGEKNKEEKTKELE